MEIVRGQGDDAQPVAPTIDNLALLQRGVLRLRQRPGPRNSLGLVKFLFPNDENVYLHGTPAQQLFERTRRDFSHGCVRGWRIPLRSRNGCFRRCQGGTARASSRRCRAPAP